MEYNARAAGDVGAASSSAVRVNDLITSVNGIRGDVGRMLAEVKGRSKSMTAEVSLTLVLERPSPEEAKGWAMALREQARPLSSLSPNAQHWTIELFKKRGKPIGANLVSSQDIRSGRALAVSSLSKAGPLARHNEAYPAFAVKKGDLFIAVNGVDWSAAEMLQQLARDVISIAVERPFPEETERWRGFNASSRPASVARSTSLRDVRSQPLRWTVKFLKEKGEKLGAQMTRNYTHTNEVVMEVHLIHARGLVATHNELQQNAAIRLGDVFTSVNGLRGDWNGMLAEFAKDVVVVEVERPSQTGAIRQGTEFSIGGFQSEPQPGSRWTFSLFKEKGQKIGAKAIRNLDYSAAEVSLELHVIHAGGLVDVHNKRSPHAAVQAGDIFLSVNGFHGDYARMVGEFSQDVVVVEVERPFHRPPKTATSMGEQSQHSELSLGASLGALPEPLKPEKLWTVSLSKRKGEKLGARVSRNDFYGTERVMKVQFVREGGLVHKHNKSHPDEAVQIGDVITSVNGVHGDYKAMLAKMAGESVVLELERPPQEWTPRSFDFDQSMLSTKEGWISIGGFSGDGAWSDPGNAEGMSHVQGALPLEDRAGHLVWRLVPQGRLLVSDRRAFCGAD
jgi:hypothetical protein